MQTPGKHMYSVDMHREAAVEHSDLSSSGETRLNSRGQNRLSSRGTRVDLTCM